MNVRKYLKCNKHVSLHIGIAEMPTVEVMKIDENGARKILSKQLELE